MEKKPCPTDLNGKKSASRRHGIIDVIRNISPSMKKKIKHTVLIVGMLILSVFAVIRGRTCMEERYHAANQTAYDSIYQTAFDLAEVQNHVSNDILISVEGAQEVSRLEVLTVSGSEYVIKNADETDKTISWLEVQGTGVFTVDLSAGEFIVDSERQHVFVRVPKPMLTQCSISGTGKQFWKNGHFFSNGSVDEGVRLSQKQLSEGRSKLEDSMKQSRTFHENAKVSAERIIELLIKQWNPNAPDLQVEVTFIEGF